MWNIAQIFFTPSTSLSIDYKKRETGGKKRKECAQFHPDTAHHLGVLEDVCTTRGEEAKLW